MRKIVDETYQNLLKDDDGFTIDGLKILILDDNALHFLTLTTTKDQIARD